MKKWMVLLLMAVFAVSSAAYAAVPSKTTQDMASVAAVVSATGATISPDFAVVLNKTSDEATAELAKVSEAVAAGSAPVTYFADNQEAIAQLLPTDFDASTLELNEFSPLEVIAYDETYGDVEVSLKFATEYTDGQVLVAMIGIVSGTNLDGTPFVEWYPAATEVVDGLVKVTFTQDLLIKLNGQEAMIAILSEPAVA